MVRPTPAQPNARPIGHPFVVSSGPLKGKTLRAELWEVQHAERGRKFVRQDRRPVDPPPIAGTASTCMLLQTMVYPLTEFRLFEASRTPGQADRPLDM